MHNFVPRSDDDATTEPAAQLEHTLAIKKWTREYLRLDPNAIVAVSEFPCVDPGCPLLETVIVVLDQEGSRRWRMNRSRYAVTKLLVQQVLATPAQDPTLPSDEPREPTLPS